MLILFIFLIGAGLSFLFELPAPGKEDIEFDLLDIDKVLIGNPFYIQVEMTNRMGSPRTVSLSVSCNSFFLTGILARKIKQERQIIVLQPYQSKCFIIVTIDKSKSDLRRFSIRFSNVRPIDCIKKSFSLRIRNLYIVFVLIFTIGLWV